MIFTILWGSVRSDKLQTQFDFSRIFISKPSAPPIIKVTLGKFCNQSESFFERSIEEQDEPFSSREIIKSLSINLNILFVS